MPRQQILENLDQILELTPGTLRGGERLADLEGWDSLAMMDFIALASDQCGVTLSPRQIGACATISDLAQLVQPAAP